MQGNKTFYNNQIKQNMRMLLQNSKTTLNTAVKMAHLKWNNSIHMSSITILRENEI